jgi:NAD(P)H-hydrate epimerase
MCGPLVSAAQMRALDRHTIEDLGIPGEVLMESAGRAVVAAVLARLAPGESRAGRVRAGQHGGDGLVVARPSASARRARGRAAPARERLSGDAGRQLARARKAGVPIEGKRWRAPRSGVIVDALFGTGLARALAGDARASVRRINAARSCAARRDLGDRRSTCRAGSRPIPARCSAQAVAADATVTIGLPKLGLAFEPGRALAGRISGRADRDRRCRRRRVRLDASLWTRAGAAAALPGASRATGTRARSAKRCSSPAPEGKTGAAVLCAEGAARVAQASSRSRVRPA